MIAIGAGSPIIFFLMSLMGYAGEKTGVPCPVLARASFAVWVAMLVLAPGRCVKAGGFSFDRGIPQGVLLEKTKDTGVAGEPGS